MALRSSNPVMKQIKEQSANAQGHRNQQAGYDQYTRAQNGFAQGVQQRGQQQFRQEIVEGSIPNLREHERAITIDDVVVKTGITLGIIMAVGIAAFALSSFFPQLTMPFFIVGTLGGLITVLVATFGRKMNSPVVTMLYAAFEGMALGVFSWLFAGSTIGTTSGSTLIFSALAGTFGVFAGMLIVYRTGAIRVTPKFTRFILASMFGVIAVIGANLLIGLFSGKGDIFGLYSGGPIAFIFSIVCIVLAAMSFLVDFDNADQAIRAGIPSSYAWGIALGLAVTLVWLYTEILRLLVMIAGRNN